MNKWLNAYLWGYKDWEAADHSFRKFREFYPDGDIYIKVDDNGDFENYKKVAEKYNAECSKNPFQIGYPGNFKDYNIEENVGQWIMHFYGVIISIGYVKNRIQNL